MEHDIKIVALDLDGTLLDSAKRLSEANRAALADAAAKGVLIVPTTGRPCICMRCFAGSSSRKATG